MLLVWEFSIARSDKFRREAMELSVRLSRKSIDASCFNDGVYLHRRLMCLEDYCAWRIIVLEGKLMPWILCVLEAIRRDFCDWHAQRTLDG